MNPLPGSPTAPQGPLLRDIHLPPDPSWWPPAPGWWLLGVLIVAMLLLVGWLGRRYRREVHRRGRVLSEVDGLLAQYGRDADQAALAGGLQQLLRRVARQHEPAAASQRGEAWQQTLARMPLDGAELALLVALDASIYRPQSVFDAGRAAQATRRWLRLAWRPRHWKRHAKTAHAQESVNA
ncbi:MAG: DUF4381 domain-containing protein [Rhodanobacter sp.]